jgi:hypothetical protein
MRVNRLSIPVLLLLMGVVSAQWQCRREPQPSQEAGTEERKRMTIEEAKEKWEAKLMAIEGVNGVGIGLTKDKKDKCIKIYVQSKTSPAPGKIPDQIEGYAAEVEVRGTFRAR